MEYVVKVLIGAGGRGTIVCRNDEELLQAIKEALTKFGASSCIVERRDQ